MSHEPSLFFTSHFSLLMTLNMSSLVFQDKKLPRRGREEDAKDCRDDPLQPPHHHQVKLFVPQGKESLLKIITSHLSYRGVKSTTMMCQVVRSLESAGDVESLKAGGNCRR